MLGAPAGWDQGELPCNALSVTHTYVGDLPAVLSYWRPDAGEMAALNVGGAVRLWGGATMAPVMVDVDEDLELTGKAASRYLRSQPPSRLLTRR